MKNIRCVLILASMLLLAACSKTDTPTGVSAEVTSSSVTSQGQNQNDVQTETYNRGSIVIQYPKITNQSKTVNKIIRTTALSILEQYKGNTDHLTLPIQYDIKRDSKPLLSVAFSGSGYVTGAAHPNNHFYTVNIDLNNSKKIALKDVVNIDNGFIQKVRAAIKQLDTPIGEYFNDISDADLTKSLLSADSGDFLTYSYFTEDSLGISLSVPHVLGDYANIELKYSDIKDNFKSDSEIAKGLLEN